MPLIFMPSPSFIVYFLVKEFLPPDKVIFEDGANHSIFHMVVSGAVEISTKNADGGILKSSKFKRNIYTLKPGAWFGELSLAKLFAKVCRVPCIPGENAVDSHTTSFSIFFTVQVSSARSIENTMLLSISYDNVELLCARFPECRKTFDDVLNQKIHQCVSSVPIFGFIEETDESDSKSAKLSKLFKLRQIPPKEVIYRQGEFGHSLFVMLEGIAEVFTDDAETKKLQHIGIYGKDLIRVCFFVCRFDVLMSCVLCCILQLNTTVLERRP